MKVIKTAKVFENGVETEIQLLQQSNILSGEKEYTILFIKQGMYFTVPIRSRNGFTTQQVYALWELVIQDKVPTRLDILDTGEDSLIVQHCLENFHFTDELSHRINFIIGWIILEKLWIDHKIPHEDVHRFVFVSKEFIDTLNLNSKHLQLYFYSKNSEAIWVTKIPFIQYNLPKAVVDPEQYLKGTELNCMLDLKHSQLYFDKQNPSF